MHGEGETDVRLAVGSRCTRLWLFRGLGFGSLKPAVNISRMCAAPFLYTPYTETRQWNRVNGCGTNSPEIPHVFPRVRDSFTVIACGEKDEGGEPQAFITWGSRGAT